MTDAHGRHLFIYADSNQTDWQEFRPGSRRKVLHEDPATGQLTMLIQWDAGYRMGDLEQHEHDEHLYILAGTFVDEQRESKPGTYILCRAGSAHQASTPDGCTFLEIVPGRSEP
jgi:quercetin dioxygenase-like cupin family protein